MSACKARAPAEGGMMKTSSGQNLYKLIFFEKIIHCNRKLFIASDFALRKTLSISGEIMSACKARALGEGGVMKTLPAQNLYKLILKKYSMYIKIIHCLRFHSFEDSEFFW